MVVCLKSSLEVELQPQWQIFDALLAPRSSGNINKTGQNQLSLVDSVESRAPRAALLPLQQGTTRLCNRAAGQPVGHTCCTVFLALYMVE